MAFDPELLMPLDEFKRNIATMRTSLEASRSEPGGAPVRVPGSAGAKNIKEGHAYYVRGQC